MSSELHLHTMARNLVSVSGFGYGENIRLQQISKGEPAAAPRIKRFNLAAPDARLSRLRGGTFRPC
ncbi:hypothetical protein M728_004649 (plasmid) [Ensifer sp. WSM1721]|uniref:hypothetical protein n=1 Tax=Ensifer sp. WSM1721 TaxID=1041159 RepID=UPI00047D3152|nr:hypothetical protein [Ensifer sp. WSM1721]